LPLPFFICISLGPLFAERGLLVLDEGHLLETEVVKFRGLSVFKRRWKRYIHDLKIVDYGYDAIEK
jgi:ATP-dependent DNA helicase DinG